MGRLSENKTRIDSRMGGTFVQSRVEQKGKGQRRVVVVLYRVLSIALCDRTDKLYQV